jgi:hypothetical protein
MRFVSDRIEAFRAERVGFEATRKFKTTTKSRLIAALRMKSAARRAAGD